MRWYLAAFPLLLLAAVACDDGGSAPLPDSGPVLGAIPWTTPETATYNVTQGDTVGKGTLQILAGVDSLVFIQKFEVPDNDVTDEITAETDAETLRPVKVDRVEDHRMEPERGVISSGAAEAIRRAKSTSKFERFVPSALKGAVCPK